MSVRIVKTPPSHPMLAVAYSLAAPLVVLIILWALFTAGLTLPGRARASLLLAGVLFALSPAMSYYNIVVKEREIRDVFQVVIGTVTVMGIPLRVPFYVVRRRQVIAVNVGGAIIPVVVSVILLHTAFSLGGSSAILVFVLALTVTVIVTYITSRVIPGVGIVTPALVPPMASSITVILLAGPGTIQGFIAYAAGALGSLIGADVLRLAREIDKLGASFLSIGGVGVFDGIFLTGALSFLLTLG